MADSCSRRAISATCSRTRLHTLGAAAGKVGLVHHHPRELARIVLPEQQLQPLLSTAVVGGAQRLLEPPTLRSERTLMLGALALERCQAFLAGAALAAQRLELAAGFGTLHFGVAQARRLRVTRLHRPLQFLPQGRDPRAHRREILLRIRAAAPAMRRSQQAEYQGQHAARAVTALPLLRSHRAPPARQMAAIMPPFPPVRYRVDLLTFISHHPFSWAPPACSRL